MNNKQYVTEQVEYQAPRYANGTPTMEGYDPSQISHDAPYIPQGMNQHLQYNQYQNPTGIPNHPQQPSIDYRALNEQQAMAQRNAQPTYTEAQKNFQKMTDIVNQLNKQGIGTSADGSDVQGYALGVAIESIYTAIRTFNEIDYWLPKSKATLAPKLKQAASPIVKALQGYVNTLEKLS